MRKRLQCQACGFIDAKESFDESGMDDQCPSCGSLKVEEADWGFGLGDIIAQDETTMPSFEGVGKVGGGTEYEVDRRVVDDDTGDRLYWLEYEEDGVSGTKVKKVLKSAKNVELNYEFVRKADGDNDE